MPRRHLMATVVERLVVLILAGIPLGVIVGGVGGRLAMLVLRVTSDSRVNGVRSDDGFVIGRFTLAGTYNLLLIGAVLGVIGAAAYQWVRPWLIGPPWFRDVTVAAASGAVVGSVLVHADGVDFTLLTPTWLAIATFVAVPALFGATIGPAIRAVERRTAALPRLPRALPAVLVAAFPLTVVPLAFAGLVLAAWTAIEDRKPLRPIAGTPLTVAAVRMTWLAIAIAGLVVLATDVADIYGAA